MSYIYLLYYEISCQGEMNVRYIYFWHDQFSCQGKNDIFLTGLQFLKVSIEICWIPKNKLPTGFSQSSYLE